MSPADKGEEENGKVDVEAAAISTGIRRKQASQKKIKERTQQSIQDCSPTTWKQ